jgi:phosphate starvation-inducible protein PhoH and related proteins
MLLTRIGMESKMILTGDIEQSDLEQRKQGGFETIINRLQDTKNIGFSHLEAVDIIRNPIIADIIYKLQ